MQGRKLAAVVKADHTVEMRPVTLGETIDNRYVIEKGLQVGDTIITEGLLKLRPGITVDPKPYSAVSPAPVR
jgi:membrane fusion protein (multidrug efflux system)